MVFISGLYYLGHKSAHFSFKGKDGKYFRLVGPLVSITPTQQCHCWLKAAIDSTITYGKIVFQKTLFTKKVVNTQAIIWGTQAIHSGQYTGHSLKMWWNLPKTLTEIITKF